MQKIKNTGWLEECYCSSWIALNYLGMGDVENAERYLNKSKYYLDSVDKSGSSHWMSMHLCSIEAFLLSEKDMLEQALHKHVEVVDLALHCNDAWVEGDACFEISKIILLYGLRPQAEAEPYIIRLASLASTSGLAHLLLKSKLISALYDALKTGKITAEQSDELIRLENEKSLASTNYIDIYCIRAKIYRAINEPNKVREAIYHIRELIYRPEYKNRPSSWQISTRLREKRENYVNFNVEYCDPFDNNINYWMRLEHLGRYLWACNECARHKNAIVADIACANGYGALLLSRSAERVYAFDRSSEYINKAPKRDFIEYVCCDLDTYPLDSYEECFDVITSFETLEHVKYPERLIELFSKMLKKEGDLLISFPNAAFEKMDEYGLNKDEYHLHVFEKDRVISMLQSHGFAVTAILGQSYCNERCNEENNAIKEGSLSAAELEKKHRKSAQDLEADALTYALPSEKNIDDSYSYILHCKKAN